MKRRKKLYCLHPGNVFSQNDIDEHYIDTMTLARLYRVPISECVIWKDSLSRYTDEYVHLYPDPTGQYETPREQYIYEEEEEI